MKYILESLNNAGTENYIYQILKQPQFSGNVDLVILGDVDCCFISKIKPFVRTIHVFPKGDKFNKYSWLYSLLKNSEPKLVHCHLYASLLPSLLIIKLLKIKSIATFHMPLSKWGMKIKITWLLSLIFIDQLIAVSTAVKRELVNFKKNINVCYAPVINELKKSCCADISLFNIIGVGRLSKEKDWPTLIKAIHILKQSYKRNVHLTICGGGPDVEMLNALIHSLNLQNDCLLTGHVDKKIVEKHLVTSDLFVLPSKFEGFGIAPVEAMQIGLPTITANYPASQDYITHDVTGWTFPIGDEVTLAKLIDDLFDDAVHREQVALVGQTLALDKFSPEKIAEQHKKLYAELIKNEY